MEYDQFKEYIVSYMKQRMGEHARVEVHSILKNNSRKLDGLSVLREGDNLSPTVYLQDYYKDFREGASLQSIVGEITDFYENCEQETRIDLEFFRDFSNIKDRIAFRLVNYERNKALLEQVPHVRTLDLAAVFFCAVDHPRLGNVTILIYNTHMELWNRQLSDLYQLAIANTPELFPAELKSMQEILEEVVWDDVADVNKASYPHSGQLGTSMYVLSNYLRVNGAAVILYPGMLHKVGLSLQKDFYIIPSSVHEVIIVPAEEGHSRKAMEQMVRQVNATQVAPEDVLADSVYYYSRKLRKILF